MADLKLGTQIGGNLVWHQGNLRLAMTDQSISFRNWEIITSKGDQSITGGLSLGGGLVINGPTEIKNTLSVGKVSSTSSYTGVGSDVVWGANAQPAFGMAINNTSSAHWLSASTKTDGTIRSGIQVLTNDIGTIRFYTNLRTKYVEISDGQLVLTATSPTSANMATRKDYVDGLINTRYPTTGGLISGSIESTDVMLSRKGIALSDRTIAGTTPKRLWLYNDSGVGYIRSDLATNSDGAANLNIISPLVTFSGNGVFNGTATVTGALTSGAITAPSLTMPGSVYFKTGSDGASQTATNSRIETWYGFGIGPSISGYIVPVGQNSIWFNARAGSITALGTGTFNAVSSSTLSTGAASVSSLTSTGNVAGTNFSGTSLSVSGGVSSASYLSATNPNDANASVVLKFVGDIATVRYGGSGTGSANGFRVCGNGDAVKMMVNDAGEIYAAGSYKVYHTNNKQPDVAQLTTARTLTVGNTGKSFNGTANVAWSLAEIGAVPVAGGSMTGALTISLNSSSSNQLSLINETDGWSWIKFGKSATGANQGHFAWNTQSYDGHPANAFHFRPAGSATQLAVSSGAITILSNTYMEFLGNANWGGKLRVGGNGRTAPNDGLTASVVTTNGNLHLDAANGKVIYLNHYAGTEVRFGNGASGFVGAVDSSGNLSMNGVGSFDGAVGAARFYAGWDSGVTGAVSCSNWFRSSGATGWYNDTYGGGIKMTDTTWIRTHGTKKFHVDNTESDAIYTLGGVKANGGFYGNLNGNADTATNADKLDGIHASGFARAYSGSLSFGGNANTITTATFVSLLSSYGAFNQPYWISRGSWSYAGNQIITDTGCGYISLAGAVVEVFGHANEYTIRVSTATTTNAGGYTRAQFVYVNNGSGYSPGWRRDYNTANPPTAAEVGALAATANAVSASKWATARTLTLSGDVSGSVSLDGSANVTLSVTVADDSHNHVISNVDGLQAALDGKLADGGTHGTVYLNNWFRSSGATGWLNSTYGGGIYMTDTTWVKTYGTKKFHVDNTSTDAIYTLGGVKANGGFYEGTNRVYSPNNKPTVNDVQSGVIWTGEQLSNIGFDMTNQPSGLYSLRYRKINTTTFYTVLIDYDSNTSSIQVGCAMFAASNSGLEPQISNRSIINPANGAAFYLTQIRRVAG